MFWLEEARYVVVQKSRKAYGASGMYGKIYQNID